MIVVDAVETRRLVKHRLLGGMRLLLLLRLLWLLQWRLLRRLRSCAPLRRRGGLLLLCGMTIVAIAAAILQLWEELLRFLRLVPVARKECKGFVLLHAANGLSHLCANVAPCWRLDRAGH
jgi:hypothetical protein